ncbi:MAG TPA: CPBP family intramembrane glutamic endopeptidase [Candidatus Limnocylindrales bacterium]|nr:CPBP family intramembrane glutamic endopeptidase [Candidatus Limnocylindrales bacterium]
MAPGVMRRNHQTAAFLAIAFGWAILVGSALAGFRIKLSSLPGIAILALVYMPAPTIAALIVERRVVVERLALPSRQTGPSIVRFFALPAVTVAAALLLFFGLTAVLGGLLHVGGVGMVVTSVAQLKANVARQYGAALANAANYPPSVPAMVVVTFVAALVAGWSINGVFSLGEEYGWRGFLWDHWKHLGIVPANLATGVVWGLWHAPLILQGYNYPGHPVAGVLVMVIFATGLSFVLSATREVTGSVLPTAATHGSINGTGALTILLTSGANPLVGGIVGLVGCCCLLLVGAAVWSRVASRSAAAAGDPNPSGNYIG